MQNQMLRWETAIQEHLAQTFNVDNKRGIEGLGRRVEQFQEFVGSINANFARLAEELLETDLISKEALLDSAVRIGEKHFNIGKR